MHSRLIGSSYTVLEHELEATSIFQPNFFWETNGICHSIVSAKYNADYDVPLQIVNRAVTKHTKYCHSPKYSVHRKREINMLRIKCEHRICCLKSMIFSEQPMDVVFHRKKGEKGQSKPFHNIYTCQEVKKGFPRNRSIWIGKWALEDALFSTL